MSKLPINARISDNDLRDAVRDLQKQLRDINQQVNMLSEGRIEARYNSRSSFPTGVVLSTGDRIWKTDSLEAGTGGSKFVEVGWVAVADGTATTATVLPMQIPTGN